MKALIATCLALMPPAAFADESGQLVPRDQCQPLYSVQKRGCVAEHVLRCETPGGLVYRHEIIEDGKLTDIEFADADFEYLDSWNAEGERFLLEMVENRDPFSLNDLLSNQVDAVDQTVMVDMQIVAPREVDFVGTAAMTGEVSRIDGNDIEEVAFIGTFDFATMVWEVSGSMFLDRLTRTLFDGPVDITIDGFTETIPGDPVRILREGDPGFMLNITMFDCGEPS